MTELIAYTAFVSFNFRKGFGGHYLSMVETVRSGIFYEPVVLDLGFSPTPLLNETRTSFIPHRWIGHGAARRQLRTALLEANTKVVFCYDIASYNITRLSLARDRVQVVYVKCGGPTLTLYYPKPDNLIVYSEEDEIFFSEKLPNSVLSKIPNRVSERLLKKNQASLSEDALIALAKAAGGADVVEKIVCIARIGHSYEQKISRAYDYLKATQKAGRAATLAVIGSVQHEEVIKRLSAESPPGSLFISDAFHTTDSARFLSNFDTAITTGRGTVEACMMGLKVLVPFDRGQQIATLDPDTYAGLIRSNFSGRARPDELPNPLQHHQTFSDIKHVQDWIRRDFAIEHATPRFTEFLDRLKPAKDPQTKDLILGIAYYFYEASRERSQIFRLLSHRMLSFVRKVTIK